VAAGAASEAGRTERALSRSGWEDVVIACRPSRGGQSPLFNGPLRPLRNKVAFDLSETAFRPRRLTVECAYASSEPFVKMRVLLREGQTRA